MRQRVLRSTKCDKRLTINVSSNNPILVLSFSSSDWKFPSHGLCLQVNIDKQRSWPIVNELCWLFQFYCGRQNSKLNKHSYSTTCIYHQLHFRFIFVSFSFHFRFVFVSISLRFSLSLWVNCVCMLVYYFIVVFHAIKMREKTIIKRRKHWSTNTKKNVISVEWCNEDFINVWLLIQYKSLTYNITFEQHTSMVYLHTYNDKVLTVFIR